MEIYLLAAIFFICILGSGISSYRIGKTRGIYATLSYLDQEGYITLEDEE